MPINFRLSKEEILDIVKDSNPKVFLYGKEFLKVKNYLVKNNFFSNNSSLCIDNKYYYKLITYSKSIKLINLKRIYKQFIVLFLDIVISLIACLLTIIIIHDISLIYNKNIILILLYSIGFIPFFITFGLYRTIFR